MVIGPDAISDNDNWVRMRKGYKYVMRGHYLRFGGKKTPKIVLFEECPGLNTDSLCGQIEIVGG